MRAMKALGALAALLAVVIGPPLALAVFIGNPWPDEGVSLSAPLTDSALIGLLAVIVWVLWAQLVGCILVEAIAALSGDRVQLPTGFALGIQQQLARRLVTAVIVAVVPAGAVLGGGAGASHASSPVASPTTGPVAAAVQGDVDAGVKAEQDRSDRSEGAAAHAQTVPVVRLDTLWGIADRVLGDGDRWPEIAALNEGQKMNDGTVFSSADQIRPGWELRVPTDAKIGSDKTDKAAAESVEHQVVAKPGDTLSEIALKELGDPNAYPSIFEASKATDQPGGARLVDPNMIDVGWTITIPGEHAAAQNDDQSGSQDGSHDGGTVEERPATPDVGAPAELESDSGARGGDVPPTLDAAPLEDLPQVQEAPEAGESEAPPAVPETPAPSAEQSAESEEQVAVPSPAGSEDQVGDDEGDWPVQTISGIGVLLAAGFIGLLGRRRARQRRGRQPGQRMPMPAAGAQAVELEVRAVANEITLDQVDVALRHLAENTPTGDTPAVRLARLAGNQLEVYLEEPVKVPAPWSGSADGAVWMLAADELAELEVQVETAAPYPGLVTVGTDAEGGVLLINLAHCGGLQAAGAPAIARDVVTAAAVELAVSPWAAGVSLTVVGGLDELVDVITQDRPGGMRYVPLLEDIDEVVHRDVDQVRVVVDATGSATTSTQRQQLRSAGVAVVAPGVDEPGAWTFEAYDNDRAMLVDLGFNVTPQLVDEATYDGLIEILRTSLAPPVTPARRDGDVSPPAPSPQGDLIVDEAWAAATPSESGDAQVAQLTRPRVQVPLHELSDFGDVNAVSAVGVQEVLDERAHLPLGEEQDQTVALQEPAEGLLPALAEPPAPEMENPVEGAEAAEDLTRTDTDAGRSLGERDANEEPAAQVAPVPADPAVLSGEEQAAAAREGWEPEFPDDEIHPLLQTGHPVVRLLGSTVDIIGTTAQAPASKSHLERCKAIAAWLVLNPDRSRAELTDAVWGTGRRVSPSTVDPRISNVRKWFGVNPETGKEYFPPRTLRLDAPVTSDWHVFTQLVGPTPEKASSTALESALGLVRGTPFKGESSQQYGFAEYVLTDMVDTIADAAYELARRRFMDSSWRKAERAARVGVIVDPANERLWRIRIHAAHAAGKPQEVEEFIDRMHARISELGFDLEAETTELIEAVRRHDSASVAEQAVAL